MDASYWGELARQVPGLAVLVSLVVLFLAHLKHRDTQQQAQQQACHDHQAGQMDKVAAMSNSVIEAVHKNTEQLGRNQEVTHQLAKVTEDVTRRLERLHERQTARA